MIPKDALINALRSLDFTFKRQADRVEIWKQRGTTRRAAVRRRDLLDDKYAETLLRQAGMPEAESHRSWQARGPISTSAERACPSFTSRVP